MEKSKNCTKRCAVIVGSNTWYYEERDGIDIFYENGDSISHFKIPVEELERTVNRYRTRRPKKWNEAMNEKNKN